jgi:N-acyl-D-amino-acid deacylase
MKTAKILLFLAVLFSGCRSGIKYDVIIRNGKICDGSGSPSFTADIGIRADTIAYIGDLKKEKGLTEIDATDLVVAPGFINMLSWANESLIADGLSQSDLRQGVTLEVLGEGFSMGPLNAKMKIAMLQEQSDIRYQVVWNTLGGYLDYLEKRGISPNIASFVGTATLRQYMIGDVNRAPSEQELDSMKLLVDQAMEEGAIGISSALEYVPDCFATTDELISLCKEVSKYDGMYISHLRNEGTGLLSGINELIRIAGEAGIRAEIYHFKQSGLSSWKLIDNAINKIDSARNAGLMITTDMYNYIAGQTGFDIIMPFWVQEGGYSEWAKRLGDPAIRQKIKKDIHEAITQRTGTADKILISGFKNDSLKYLTGKTLAEIARMRKKSPEETVLDLVIQDGSRVGVIYFTMSEDNVRRQVALPWMSFGSDAGSDAPEGNFLKYSVHPRAYGNFARLLGKYVREEKIISIEEAIRRLTALPASNMKIVKRGKLQEGYYADVVIFDPEKIADKATFETPRQYATGVLHVFVNGKQVIKDGEHTGAKPGRVVRGPGFNRRKNS